MGEHKRYGYHGNNQPQNKALLSEASMQPFVRQSNLFETHVTQSGGSFKGCITELPGCDVRWSFTMDPVLHAYATARHRSSDDNEPSSDSNSTSVDGSSSSEDGLVRNLRRRSG